MSRKSQRNKLRRFIESLPAMAKVFNFTIDKRVNEIATDQNGNVLKFFYDKGKDSFIVFRKGEDYCEIEEVKFTHRETDRLNQLIDDFIHGRLSTINDKSKGRGIKRIAPRPKNKNKK